MGGECSLPCTSSLYLPGSVGWKCGGMFLSIAAYRVTSMLSSNSRQQSHPSIPMSRSIRRIWVGHIFVFASVTVNISARSTSGKD